CYLISSDDYDKVNARSKVETGDILLSMIGTLGRTYLECDEVNYAIKNIGLFKTSQNPVWKYFIYLWLNSVQGKQFVDEHKSGSTQEYLSLGSLRGIQLKSPPNDLLLIFNAKVDNWFKK
ncbi:restriction endonuclease subunit S, partial [bacterium LRH843]|nr:restriction endonuclease subunit S [bacterium LRH843]